MAIENELLKEYLNNFIANTSLYSIFMTDLNGTVIFLNKGAKDLFGYQADEVVGKKSISELIAKNLPDNRFADFLRHVADKGSYGRDLVMLNKNRKTFVARLRLAPIRNESGKAIGFVAFARDLSHRKKIEQDIISVKNELEVMFDSIPENMFVIDRNFKILRSNRALLNSIGKDDFSQILNCRCNKLMQTTGCKQCPARETFKTGKPASRIVKYGGKDGARKYQEIHTFPIEKKGRIQEVLVHAKDITERKRLENKILRQNAKLLLVQEIGESMHSSEKLDELLNKILNSILKLGFNRSALYLTSVSENKLKGVMSIGFKHDVVKDISMPLDGGKNNLISKVFSMKKPLFVKNIFDPDTKVYVAEEWLDTFEGNSILVIPLLMEDEVIGILTVDMRDKEMKIDEDDLKILELFANNAAIAISRATLDERLKNFNENLKKKVKEATAELTLKNRRLEELDRMKNQFLSTISHELKTPLTSIKGYASLLQGGKLGELTVEQKKSIEVLNAEAQRLNELITNLIDLTKLETGRAKLELVETDLNELIESVIHDMKAKADEKQITMEFSSAAIGKIKLDPNLIALAVKNLVSNAIKYNKEKGRVKIIIKDEDAKIFVEVNDTGRGIKKERIAELFGKFHQLDEHTIRYADGIGIGLAIVKSIVDKHNGVIKIDSVPGKSTAVAFSIPKNLIVEEEEETEYSLRRTIDELRSIRKVFSMMQGEKSLKEVLTLILEEVHRTIGFDRIRLYLLENKGKILKGTVAIGTPDIENFITPVSEIKSSRLLKSMFESKQAEIVEMAEKQHLAEGFEPATKLAVMPLLVKGNVIGMIAADNLYSKKKISDEDLKSLTIFANGAAISIENFRLYEQTEQKVKNRTMELVRLNRQKDEYLSYVSHEMRTPLTSLLGYSKLLLSKKLDKSTKDNSIKIIFSESERLKNMINNFLDLSKIEAGKVKLEKKDTDLVAQAEKVRDIMKKQADEKGLDLSVESAPALKVKCDKDKIEQVLLNLVSNGIKFTEKGSVRIILRDRRGHAEVEVKDTGIGIAKKDFKKVFSKFEQIKNELKTERGTGLGMAISKNIIELHKGKIWIRSRLNKGSSFIFTLPK